MRSPAKALPPPSSALAANRDAGAGMIFAEALTSLDDYRRFVKAVRVPVLANITEFGKTPLFTVEELRSAGVSVALYPCPLFAR